MSANSRQLNDLFREIMISQQRLLDYQSQESAAVTQPQARALMLIQERPGLIQRELADLNHRRSASISNLLQNLERDGYIERRADEESARIKRIYLTPKAEPVVQQINASFNNSEARLVQNLSDEEQTTLIQLLTKVADNYRQ